MNLIVYVNDIFIIGSNKESIVQLKLYLGQKFQTKGLGHFRNFLWNRNCPFQGWFDHILEKRGFGYSRRNMDVKF